MERGWNNEEKRKKGIREKRVTVTGGGRGRKKKSGRLFDGAMSRQSLFISKGLCVHTERN